MNAGKPWSPSSFAPVKILFMFLVIGLVSSFSVAGQAVPVRGPAIQSDVSIKRVSTTLEQRSQPLTFIFDGDFISSPELVFSLFRPINTWDPAGNPVNPNVPRYAGDRLLTGAPVVELVYESSDPTRILASGLDHDGVTPLLVVSDSSNNVIDVYTVADEEIIDAARTGVGRNRTELGLTFKPDIMQGQFPEYAYDPHSGAICHGLIVLMCQIWENFNPDQNQWFVTGTGIVVSQDEGQTWQVLYSETRYRTVTERGSDWAMQNWWPLDQQSNPLEAYFAGTDYQHNPGAHGGRSYMFRATRDFIGAPWNIESVKVVFDGDTELESQHAHAAGIIPYGENGLQMLVAIGDSKDKNRIESYTRTDTNYINLDWIRVEDYHGSRYHKIKGTPKNIIPPSKQPAEGVPGTSGYQYVGCAPFPDRDSIIVGTDLDDSQIDRIIPDLENPAHASEIKHLYGYSPAEYSRSNQVFVIRTPTPESGGPYLARSAPISQDNEPHEIFASRAVFSPDGIHWDDTWAYSKSKSTQSIHGGHIYSGSFVNEGGIFRTPIPNWIIRRPILIGPGGLQRQVDNPGFNPGVAGHITRLGKNADGKWVFAGQPLDPQPPCDGPVYRISSNKYSKYTYLGSLLPMGSQKNLGSILGIDDACARWWVINRTTSVLGGVFVDVRNGSSMQLARRKAAVQCTDTWVPQTKIGLIPNNADKSLLYRLEIDSVADDRDLFIALESLIEGVSVPGYPIPTATDDPPTTVNAPDELADIYGFNCGDTWTITIAGEVPDDSWDSSIDTPRYLPLFTIYSDENNYIEFKADIVADRLYADIINSGSVVSTLQSQTIWWLRGSNVLISVTEPDDGTGIHITASLAGQPAREMEVSPPWLLSKSMATQPTRIRFGSHYGTSSDGYSVHVAPMIWYGGQINTTTSLDRDTRNEMLRTLSFLTSPGN